MGRLGLALALVTLMGWGLFQAAAPASALSDGSGPVVWIWSGAVTSASARVNVHLDGPSAQVRLAVSPNPDLSNPIYSTPAVADANNGNTVALDIAGLSPDTDYFYAVEVDGALDTSMQGQFHTFPAGASSFRFAFAGDAV